MKRKRILTDPTFWVLLGLNGYLVYRFYRQHDIFMTLLYLYWAQSMLLGLFTALDLLTTGNKNVVTPSAPNVVNGLFAGKIPGLSSAKFFIVTYGALHLFYLLFLISMRSEAKAVIQWDFFKYFFYAFLAGQVINFIQSKIRQRREPTYIAAISLTPFIRVLPMHLTIVLAAFFPSGGVGIFLILKSIVDVVMYVVTKPRDNSREADTAAIVAQQNM